MSCKSERERDFEELMSSLETELFENFENAFALFALSGVLLGQANVISSRSLIRPALFDLELEWTVGVGDWGGREDILISVVFPQAAARNDTFTKCLSTHDPFSLSYLYSVSLFCFCFCLSLRSIQEHAAKMFPSNVENRTIHSLAYRKVGFRLEEQYS